MQITDQIPTIKHQLNAIQRQLFKWFVDVSFTNVIDKAINNNQSIIIDCNQTRKLNLWLDCINYTNNRDRESILRESSPLENIVNKWWSIINDEFKQSIGVNQAELIKPEILPKGINTIRPIAIHNSTGQSDFQTRFHDRYIPQLTQLDPEKTLKIAFQNKTITLSIKHDELWIITDIGIGYIPQPNQIKTIAILSDAQFCKIMYHLTKYDNHYQTHNYIVYDGNYNDFVQYHSSLMQLFHQKCGLLIPNAQVLKDNGYDQSINGVLQVTSGIYDDQLELTYDEFNQINDKIMQHQESCFHDQMNTSIITHQGEQNKQSFTPINHNNIVQTLAQLSQM